MKHPRHLLAAAVCSLALAGCSQPQVATLADLPGAGLPAEPDIRIPQVQIDTLQRNYKQALVDQQDPAVRRQIRMRLADLEMERLEQLQADNPGQRVSFQPAIERYRALVAAQPGDDYLNYRLARAEALDGNQGAALQALENIASARPESPFIAEVLFRRGEAAFNDRRYRDAARDFDAVLAQGESPFTDNARYMLGWSQFKASDYPASTRTFLGLLDTLHSRAPLDELDSGDRRLADDSLRGLALGFSYQGGAGAIEPYNPDRGARPYQHRIYRALGDWYREKERFREGADSYLAFVENYPGSAEAPALHLRAIETLQQAGLDAEVMPAKREFVRRYGIHSDYWQAADDTQREQLGAWLRPWLAELARFDHARAQALQQEQPGSPRERRQLATRARQAYLAAAAMYREYTETFPQDIETPAMAFLLAECLEQAGDRAGAWRAYRNVASTYPKHEQATEAGYSAILNAEAVYRETAAQANAGGQRDEQATLWRDRAIEAGQYFVDTWPRDPRALPVLLDAADKLFQQRRYAEVIVAAERAARWQPPPDLQQRRNLNLLLGHSYFEQRDYPAAEQAYARVLAGTAAGVPAAGVPAAGDSIAATARQKMQAAIYRQAEAALAQGDSELAITHLLRVRDSGRTDIAATAQYDAINQLVTLEQWQRAATELADFRSHYPAHALTPTLTAKAVVIYQALQMPGAASAELLRLAQSDADPQVRRQSLFLAAEGFREAGETDRAIAAFQQYSEQWQEPREQQLEAQYQLVQLTGEAGDSRARTRWLQRLGQAQPRSERARYLAAYARSELAEQSYQAFAGIPLALPLKASLASKKRALETTVADYREVLDLGVAEFSTQANFRLAEVYRTLSGDLMDSERPPGLSPLELEQYDILLEEQAFPFEEKAIELHEANIQRTADGMYDDWVRRSFRSLAKLLPARYQKPEQTAEWSDALH
ncbi:MULTISPECIES: tetratricopeptide repeat protein [Microbulbifer]|uniref:tetratricopeptide repeat protein n=1 Tax=Microbulbifer TaxID=48073 RepID=UPI001E613903|nr:tetratricopeptide repeat protein [Microbulbifer sp. YPW16]UHQ53771.1 tetratricopeptide repeat protein [Microbulbifer sp. YPW16]